MPAEKADEAELWLAYARQDLAAAGREFSAPGSVSRIVCGLAQQAAEKALKAGLLACGITPPRQHNLDPLRNLLPDGWRTKTAHPDLAALTFWSIESRYPSDFEEPTAADATAALDVARSVVASLERDLQAMTDRSQTSD